MAKIQLKSDNINPFGGLFSIFSMFNRSGLRSVIDGHLGRRGWAKAAFTRADKKDAKYPYKKADGYFPGAATAWVAIEKAASWIVLPPLSVRG